MYILALAFLPLLLSNTVEAMEERYADFLGDERMPREIKQRIVEFFDSSTYLRAQKVSHLWKDSIIKQECLISLITKCEEGIQKAYQENPSLFLGVTLDYLVPLGYVCFLHRETETEERNKKLRKALDTAPLSQISNWVGGSVEDDFFKKWVRSYGDYLSIAYVFQLPESKEKTGYLPVHIIMMLDVYKGPIPKNAEKVWHLLDDPCLKQPSFDFNLTNIRNAMVKKAFRQIKNDSDILLQHVQKCVEQPLALANELSNLKESCNSWKNKMDTPYFIKNNFSEIYQSINELQERLRQSRQNVIYAIGLPSSL